MPPFLRLPAPPRPLLRLPAHLINGIAVALGIALVQVLVGSVAGLPAALVASGGAVFASLADTPNAPHRTWRRVLTAALVGSFTSVLVTLLRPWPVGLGLATVLLAFGGSMSLAWGPRAGALSFVPILALVFTMAAPANHGLEPLLVHTAWTLLGAGLYLGWAVASAHLLQPRYRSLALANALAATATLLRSRARLLPSDPWATDPLAAPERLPLQAWIEDQVALDERLQAARDLLFAAVDHPAVPRQIGVLLQAVDLRDTLLTSELDLDLLGHDLPAAELRAELARRLTTAAAAIDTLAQALRLQRPLPAPPSLDWQDLPPLPAGDGRGRLVEALRRRSQHIAEDLQRMHSLLHEPAPRLALSRSELQLFVSPEGWPLAALKPHLSLASPVTRHALRMGVALGCAYALGLVLPWAAHPHWLVLSVAVVLRGNLEQTLSRRDARVAGTVLGCLFVLLLARLDLPGLSTVVFLVAVGVAHSFVLSRYLVTAAAATVMALLQAHLAHPAGGFGVGERLADTVLGALLAWGFSYLLPWWEQRGLRLLVARVQRSLAGLAREALRWPAGSGHPGAIDPNPSLALRLARREVYDAIGGIAAAARRTSVEPERVQLPLYGLATLLVQSHLLVAQLAAIRMMLTRRGDELDHHEAEAALQDVAAEVAVLLQPLASAPASGPASTSPGWSDSPPPPDNDALMPWLHRRLHLSVRAAARVAEAARALV